MAFARLPRAHKQKLAPPEHTRRARVFAIILAAFAALTVSAPLAAKCLYTNPDRPLSTLPDAAKPADTATLPPVKPAEPPKPSTAPSTEPSAAVPGFAYYSPGDLNPKDKDRGRVGDRKVYLPDIVYPIRLQTGLQPAPAGKHAFMNSQIWGYGGGGWNGKGAAGGSECDPRNFNPMMQRDNFCEVRGWAMPMCPSGQGHQGQDIRPPKCEDNKWEVLAVVDGIITQVTSNTTVRLKGGDGTEYYYLHMHPDSIKVKDGSIVKQGDVLGRISNFMNGGRETTHHLHFQVSQSVRIGKDTQRVYVPVFSSLIAAYRRSKGLDSGIDAAGNLIPDPAREVSVTPVDAPAPAFVTWPIPNVTGTDGQALPPLSVVQYFKPKDPKTTVKYAATGLPGNLTINASTGAIKGNFDANASKGGTNGAYTVTVMADDGKGNTAQQSFTIETGKSPPVIGTATRGKFFKDGGRVLIDAGAAFLNPSGFRLTYSATGLPPGVIIVPSTGRISGKLSKTASKGGSNGGVYSVTVTATDGKTTPVNERFTITAEPQTDPNAVVPDLPPPVVSMALPSIRAFNGQAITNINAATGFSVWYGASPLRYSAVSLPINLTIDPDTGIISGTLADNASKGGDNGSYTVKVIADNGEGGTASQSFIITSRNAPPVLSTPTINKTYNEGETVDISVGSAFAAPDPTVLSYTISGLPPGLTYSRTSGRVSGKIAPGAASSGQAGIYTIQSTVDDGKGGTASQTFTITAVTPPPTPPPAPEPVKPTPPPPPASEPVNPTPPPAPEPVNPTPPPPPAPEPVKPTPPPAVEPSTPPAEPAAPRTWTGWAKEKAAGTWSYISNWWTKPTP